MIVWSGLGFLVAVIALACALAAQLLTESAFGEAYYSENKWPMAVALVVAAALCWGIGSALHRRSARTVIDKESGEEIELRASHSLFFVPMRWWGPILLVVAVVLLATDLAQ